MWAGIIRPSRKDKEMNKRFWVKSGDGKWIVMDGNKPLHTLGREEWARDAARQLNVKYCPHANTGTTPKGLTFCKDCGRIL